MNQTRLLSTLACATVLLAGGVAIFPMLTSGRTVGVVATAKISGLTTPLADRVPTNGSPSEIGLMSISVAARGRVEPISEQLELSIGVLGTLSQINVTEGDQIIKGQLLAELDNSDQKARVGEAQATLQLREAQLEKLLNGARPEERRIAAAQYDESQANLALARQQVDRRTPLAANGVASREMLDQATSALGVAIAKNDASAAALALINAPPRDEDVAMAKANVALAKADLDVQLSLLEKTRLRSPIDGVVLRRYLKPGETISIQPLIPILAVGDSRHLRVRAEIDESDVGRIVLGQSAWVSAPAYPNHRWNGTVFSISPTMGKKTVGSDQPTEKNDTKILEVVIDLEGDAKLPVGLRVDVYVGQPKVAQD